MVNVCVQHFDLYKLPRSKLTKCEYLVSGSVRFRPEQISAVVDSVSEQRQPDHTMTSISAADTGKLFVDGAGGSDDSVAVHLQ